MAERPLYTLYKNLKAQNYDVPDDYNKFESALTRDGKGGADNRHAIYENLKAQNFDVPNTYERFYSALFEPRSKTSSRAKGGSVPMSAADRARFSAGAAAISASAQHTMNNAGRYNRLKQRKQKQQKDFGRVNLGTHQTPYGGDANNVVKDDFAYNPETGKAGAYVSSDNENVYSQPEAEQKQDVLDQQNNAYQEAVDTGEIPSVFDVRDKNGNYDLQENINKNGTYLTEEGARNQFDKKLADAYARKKEIEALIAEDHRQHGNPLLSYGASIGASNGRTAEQSDYSNKLATSLALVKQQIGALEAVKQYPTSSWGEDALKALDNTAFTAKTWDFGLTDFATMGQIERIKTKMDNNLPLSGSDKMLLKSKLGADAAAALEDEKMGNIYRWTKIAGQSLPFMADFFLTGGYGGITKAISRGALKFAAKRGMGKVSAAILKNTGIVAGDVIGSYAMAGSEQAMKTGADIMQRHLGSLYQDEKGDYKFGTFDENGNLLHEGGESMGTALYKGLTSAMVENYTEKLFGHSYGIKKGAINFMEKHGMNASAEFFKNIGKSGWYTNSKKWMEKFGINGFGEEVMEEEIGIPLHALLDGDNKFSDLLDTKQQLDIIGGMALSVGSMYAMGAGSRPVKGVYNRAQYYRFRNKVNVADSDAQNLMGDKWADIKDKIDNTTNEQMGGVLADILRQRDTMSKDQINAAINYGINLMKMRGYNVAKTAEMNAREITNEPTTPEEQHKEDIDNAYSEGHDADDADKHDIQLEHEDQMKTLAGLLNISEQQLSAMNDDELQSLTGQKDKLNQAIYDYQLSSARYQGVTDDAQDKIDMAANQAAQRVDMYTDKSRGSVRNATVKASGGAEDYGVYIISGNIATNEDGSINVADSDDMILFYDPTTNSVEHADALRFAELGDEVPADDVKAQAVADAKEKAIKEVAGIVDGTIDVGSQFKVTGADGLEHTYEILADYGDGTAAISIDGNVVENPYSLEDLQQLKDLEDQKRLEAAKAQREQMEKERAEQQTQETEQPEETQPSLDFNQILNDNGNVVLVDVLDKDGNTKYPDSRLFLIRDAGAKAKVVELKSDGTIVPHAVNKEDVATISSMSLDEYKQAMPESSMIEENSGENRGEIEVETPTIEGETAAPESTETPETEQTPAAPAITLEDGTIVPMLEDGNPDFSKLTAAQTAELYDTQFGEDADSIVSGYVSDAKKAFDKASNMTVKGKTFVEQKAAKDAKEKAIADAQAAYDSAIAIRDAYNERQLAKVEDTAEGRKELIEKARRKFSRLKSAVKDDAEAVSQLYKDVVGSLLHRLYDGTGIDVTDTIPLTAEEYVASNLGAHSLNYEGTETSKGVKQETGLSREDFAKTQLLAADGKGTTIDDLVHSLWENRPSNLESLDTQDIRNALIGVLTSGFKASEARNYIENLRIAQAENILEEQKKAADNAAFAEENKAESEQQTETAPESEEKTEVDSSDEINDEENEQTNAPELSNEQQKAMEEGEKLGFPAFDKEGEPINEYVVELAKWAKKQGLGIDPTSKLNSYADLFLMCKDGFGVITLVPDEGENINQVVYFPDNVKGFDQLWKLQEEFNAGRDLKHSSNIDSELTEGAIFYDGDTAREFKEFVDKKVEKQNKVFGEQRPEEDIPFSAKENGKQQTTAERAADVEKNKVDDMKVVDNIVGEKTRKAFERLAKMMGAKIQWQYSDKLGNGWIQETKDADGNIHRTIFITLDSSITEGAQFIFGHEMTHQIKNLNPAAYNELTQLVLDTYGSDAFDKAVDETMQRYSDAGFSGRARDYYAEEVVADSVGEMIRDLNLAHTLAMKMSHPLLAAIHEILQKVKLAFFGTEYSDVTKNIIRSIEQAYVKTANGQVTNSETGEDVSFSLRQKPEPKKKGIGYKVFVLKDGKLYPPMVANPDGAATPVGVWLDADAAPIAGESKTGRPQVKQGGKGTQGGSGKLAYRPGWHLGVVPYAIQFNRKDAEGNKTLFPKNFVFAEVEYAADVDYQEEARQEGINPSGKYQHSLAGLKHLPTDGYYMYRTNPNPETDPWVITGAMKVNRILTRAEQADLVSKAGREPQQIQDGDIVTDDVVNSINQEIAAAPKFSLKVYHGSGADFTEFDFDHMGEGAGSQAFGWGGYVTSSKKIGKSYVELTRKKSTYFYNGKELSEDYLRSILLNKVGIGNANILDDFLYNLKKYGVSEAKSILRKGDYAYFKNLLKGTRGSIRSGYQNKVDAAELILAPRNIRVKKYKGNLYEVDIPEDNGSNYLNWDAPITDELIDKVAKALPSLRSYDIVDLKKDRTFDNFYKTISMRSVKDDAAFNDDKAASKLLASLGYTGIKYKAGRNFGGAEEGDTNYVIFKPEDMKITEHTKFSLKSKPVRFEAGKKLSDEEKKEVLSTLKDAYKVNGVPYHIEETAGGKEKRVYEPTADSYVVSDITNRPLRYYITLPDGRVAHPTEVYPNISDNEVKSSATKQGLLDDEADQIVSAAIGNMKDIADNAKAVEILTELQNLPHETHDVGYGLNHARSYNYKTGIFTSDAAQAIDYVVRRMRRKEDVPAEIPAALKKAVADSYGMVDNLIDGMSNTKVGAAEIKPVGVGAFGNIYNQFRGKAKAAIEFLKKVRGGEAVGALHHKDIGDIDLVWGKEGTGHSDGYGLSKLVKYHPEVLDNLQEILNDMRVVSSSKNRVNLESETHKAGVRLTWDGERKSWLLTAFKKETSASDKRTDTAATSLEGDTALSQTEGSAAKIDNSSETTKGNGEKFSLKDEKTMFGMHNISIDKLRKAIKQGGFAAPSMGVVDSKNGIYSDYGEITLIPKAEKLAQRTGKNAGTFTADAWTPTYPQVERIMNKQGEKAFNTDMNEKLGDVDNGIYSNIRESWKGYFSSGDVRDGLYWHYLFDKGMNPKTIYQTGKYDNDITNEVMRISDNGNKTDYTDKEVKELIQLMNKATGEDNDVEAMREKLKARIASAEKQGNHLLAALKKKRLAELEGVENFYIAADFVNDVVRNNRKNGKVDVHDTMSVAKEKVENDKKLSADFPSWLDKKTEEYGVEEMLYNGTTPSGKPKYIPNTIDNAVKLMKKQGVAGGYTAFGSELGVFIAKNSPEVNTLDAMKNAKDKLIPFGDERHNQIKDKITKEFLELSDEIRVGSNNRYAFDDSGVSRMVELTDHKGNEKEFLKKAYNVEVSDEWMDRYNKLLDTIKKDYKVFYFETKFMRPYGLDEFEKAIVPSDTPSDVVDALKKAGIDVSSYERGNAEDRQKVTMDAINSSDNIRFSLKSMMAKPEGWKQANKKAIHIAEAIERDPKFSLKNLDGTLIKAGTYFSGGGLVEEGLKGIIDPVVAVEYDEKISGVYRNNFGQHIVTADVRDVDPKELVKQIDGEVEYFHASPVCKNYSQAKSNHAEVELDKETAASTAEFINAVKPKVVTIENVKGYKDSEAMKTITDALDVNGYTWDADVYNAADYGGYTNRERLIVRAVRDGKLPEKPKKMAHKSGWYEAVEDIIPTMTEKKNGVAPWMDVRLKADGIDWRNIDKPLYVMGSAYADGKIPHAFADELLPTLRTKSGDVIVMPDGKVYRAMGRVLARVSGVSDDYKMPFSENLSHTIIGNGIPTQLTEHVIAPLLTGSDPKFSIRTYHGTGASFDKFDLSHALEGEGSESFGHGVYVTNSSKIGREYAQRAKNRKMEDLYKNMRYPDGVKGDIFKRRVFGEMVNDVATGGSVASAKEFAKKRIGADANDIQRTLENLKDREKGTEYEQNLKNRLAEYKEGLKWIDSLDEEYLTQGNANRYDVEIPDDNGSNYLDWEGTIPDSLDKQKVAEDAYKVVSDNQGFNDFKATPLNDFIAHTLKTYVNTTDVAGRVEKLKSDIKDVIENYVADDDVLALNEYLKDATPDDVLATIWYNDLVRDIKDADLGEELYRKLSTYVGDNVASQILSDNGLVGIKYPAGMIHGGAKEGDYNYVIFDENNANIVGNTRFSLRYDKFEHDLNQWKKDNNLPKDAQRPTIPQRNAGESAVDFLRRVDEYRKQMALWKTAPTYEQHLLSDDTALGEFNRELQRGSVLKRIAFQDSMLAIRKAQEAIMNEVGVDRLNMAEDAYTAENRSHGKGKNEFEEYNNEFLQPLRKAYHQMKKVLGNSYDNVRVYMMAKHGLERDAQMAFKKSLEADYEDVNQRSAAYKAYKNDLDRVSNDADLEFGRVDFTTWRQKDNALRGKYSPSYMDYRYDDNGIAYDYSGLSSLFDGSDFEEAAHRLVRDVETKHLAEVQALWNATNAATKKILRDGFKAGMMSKDAYEYVKGMYSHYIPLRGWDGTTADQVWDYIGGGKGAFNQTLKTAHGRTSIADDPIAYIENMAESGILLNNKNWVKQHLMLLAQNHPTSLLTLSKAWYVKSTDANGNEEWIPATPQITSQMNSNQVKAAIDAFEQKMEQMAQTGDATQQRDGLNIAYPQTHSEEREHEVRVMKDGEEYVIYVNGDPQLAQAMNNTRAHRVREIQSGKLDRAAAWLGRKMAAAYTSLSPLFIPSNYFRDLTMTLASTAIREDGRYNYLLRKNLATSWNLGFMLKDYQNGKLREKVSNGNATPKEQMFYDFMMNGGETGFVSSLDVEDLKKKFKNDLKDLDRWKANPVKVGHTIMDGIEFLNRAIEDSNRFAVYMTSIQYGRSIDEAVNDAKDVTLNFNRKGTGEYGWQMIRNLYLFINPAVQSLQTLGALTKHHPFKFTAVTAAWLASGVLVPIVNAALMSLLGGDDDKDKYWQFSKWDRRNNAIMWIPFTNEYVKIPLAQEFRAFYGIGDMIASKMMGGELAEETWSQYAEDLLGQVVDMLPLDPTGYDGNIAVSLMPNPIRPVFELAFNVDFTGKPLFKDTEYNKYDPNFTKAYVGTPDWLVRVSKMVNSIGNDYPDVQQNAIDAFGDPRYNLNNPAVVDHVLSSYLGGAYTMGSQVLGVLTKSLNDPKKIKVADIPLFSKFVSNPDDRPVSKKQGDEFWDKKEYYDRASNTISKLKKQAKIDGDYSLLERFYGSEEYKTYKLYEKDVKDYKEARKKERAEESGDEYRPHQLNAEDIYNNHATTMDEFEDMKLKQLFEKLNSFKTRYDAIVDNAPNESDSYYNTNKAAIDAIDEISLDKQEISELKKGFLEDGKDTYNADDMKRIRELRKRILSVLEPANKVVVANQKAKAEKK